MNLSDFSKANLRRCVEGFKHQLFSWSAAEWTNAVCGEAGAAANAAKKLIRLRDNITGNRACDDVSRAKVAKKLADVIIYADLAIQAMGFSTTEIVREVWNAKSAEIGYAERI